MEKLIATICLFLFSYGIKGQVTTGTIEGKVADQEKNAIPFAKVLATHVPTGTIYGTNSAENGNYVLANLKPGGPYSIKYESVGYQKSVQMDVFVSLGQTTTLNIALQSGNIQLNTIEINAEGNSFSKEKDGVSSHINSSEIEGTPSLNRSLQDITRLVPQGGQSSFGGSNYRYNNLSIDGASNNDALGFQEPASGAAGSVASGTPGGLAGTQPISLDAIQEVQVAIAPYDVKQGNFTGASINAVTRSGSNQLHGSTYFFGRNQLLTGKGAQNNTIANYHDFQTGFRAGGPIKKNKVFWFANYEKTNRLEPVLNAPGSDGVQISEEIAQAVKDTLMSRYGYDAGAYGALFNQRTSDKLFFRLDFNLGTKHQLTIRDNLVMASADNLDRGANFLNFSSQGFTHHSNTNSFVTELKSSLNNDVFNHLVVGFNSVNDHRSYEGEVFPHLEITYNTANTIFAGTYREASIYGLSMNTTQITDNLKFYKNKHTFTLGTNNDIYQIEYRFLTAWNGRWEYRSLDDFFNDRPKRIRGVYNYNNNDFAFNRDNPSADFRVLLLSGYLQDKYKVSDKLSVTTGIRLDMQVHPDQVPINQHVVNTPEFAHFNNKFGGVPQFNPRFSFNYLHHRQLKIRGGSGLFTGRIPFAWYAYSHYISGHNYGNIDLKPGATLPITSDLSTLEQLQPNLTEINLIDNDFKLPRAWKSSIAIDYELKDGTLFTLEGLFSKTVNDIWFRSINLKDSTAKYSGGDSREYYLGNGSDKKVNPNFTNVFLLTNTNLGYQYFITASVSKSWKDKLFLNLAYTIGESKDVMNGVRNSMAANFNWNQAVSSNNPELSWSNFDVRNRVVSSARYSHNFNQRNKTSFVLIYTGRSGFPFSYTVAGDVNNDGSSKNDLFYVPTDESDIQLKDIENENGDVVVSSQEQWRLLDQYINNNEYLNSRRGDFTQRNGARAPWNHLIDLRIAHSILTHSDKSSERLELTLDVINVLNLMNKNWGQQSFVPNVQNSSFQLIDLVGVENNSPIYQFNNPQGTAWQVDQLNSRWQAQLGIRYSF